MKQPEKLRKGPSGVMICALGRYYPVYGRWDLYTEPHGPRFGVAAKGQVYRCRRPFGLKANPRKFSSITLDWLITKITGTLSVASMSSLLANQFDVALKGKSNVGLQNMYPALYEFGNVHVTNVGKPTYTLVAEETLAGAATSWTALCPLRSAIVVKKETGKAGREFQGRLYLPSPAEPAQTAGVLKSTSITPISNTLPFFLSGTVSDGGGNGADYSLCVISEKLTKSTGALVATPVTKLLLRATLGTMRSRQRLGNV